MEQRAKFVDFNGFRFRLSGRYYRKNCWSQLGPSNLHRAVWESANGPIAGRYGTFITAMATASITPLRTSNYWNGLGIYEIIPSLESQPGYCFLRQNLRGSEPPEWHASPEGIDCTVSTASRLGSD